MSIEVQNESARCKMVAPPRLGYPDQVLVEPIFNSIDMLNEWVFRFDILNGEI